MGQPQSIFSFFAFLITVVSKCSILFFADDWIWIADLWNWKWPLYQLRHNHCPRNKKNFSARIHLMWLEYTTRNIRFNINIAAKWLARKILISCLICHQLSILKSVNQVCLVTICRNWRNLIDFKGFGDKFSSKSSPIVCNFWAIFKNANF